eukprot:TRINITY_DN4370_c0_g2_i2.p1 TRINITY_DN4370_c0_g2~~TRINITY_DN4370_c0_g2_i2.p1  ORF type:complete len:196 (+),score=66.21 TRINITY_DN4370_c0_g2_i2:403-990(+)
MAQLSGSKRWRIVHPDDLPLLAPDWRRGTLDPAFPSLDEMTADPERYPLLRQARIAEVELRPGDLLFVPSGAAHQVVNLETPSVAVGGNFVDSSNRNGAMVDLELMGLRQGGAMAEVARALDELDIAPEDDLRDEGDGEAGVPYAAFAAGAGATWRASEEEAWLAAEVPAAVSSTAADEAASSVDSECYWCEDEE